MKLKDFLIKTLGLCILPLLLIQFALADSSIRPYVKIAIIESGDYQIVLERLEALGFTNTTIVTIHSGLATFSSYDMVYLANGWASSNMGDPDSILAQSEDYKEYIENGGCVLVEQPNPYMYNNGKIYVTLLPVPVTFTPGYNQNDFPAIIADTTHFLTNGLSADKMPFPADQVVNLDTSSYHVLSYGKYTRTPSLFVMEHGNGRVLVHTASPALNAGRPLPDTTLVRIITWLAPNVNSIPEPNNITASSFELKQNYPNPFNPQTQINYTLSFSSTVEMIIYNILGKKVQRFSFGIQHAGHHSWQFNAENLPTGIYYYELKTSAGSKVRKMMLVK